MATQNSSEFQSGGDYDTQYQHPFDEEIQFLTRLARQHHVRHVLDVCCGTGITEIMQLCHRRLLF
ncbi:hypothetical protein [Gynuella sunshinyii]|uniref:Uncharacterized protein n=1 Tax=Gynuella sunshinyii YC6258 TaxID=1445510 RepID=A0A0C5UYN9_9GAMM|nr:hypothetical protein [Gynuella sunshinyii]AJQ92430.1 hypothetical Protein YC6258_00380 [Gynuella sunshinyii YC6258]